MSTDTSTPHDGERKGSPEKRSPDYDPHPDVVEMKKRLDSPLEQAASTPRSPNVTVVQGGDAVRVRINGLLHLHLDRHNLLAVQAWETGIPGTSWAIEFTFKDGTVMKSEYSRKDIWEAILKGAEGALHA